MQLVHRLTVLSSLALSLLLRPCLLGAQTVVIDLTNTTANLAEWKIMSTQSEGAIGTWPKPKSMTPVAIRLNNCTMRGPDLYFSVEIDNSGEFEAQIPVSPHSKTFTERGTTSFRELLINLGTLTNDGGVFKTDLSFEPITLFGSASIPGSTRILAPKERLILQLKTNARLESPDLSKLRVQIAGSEVTLTPHGAGYDERRRWIPALFATSPIPSAASTR
jgi:hypothetical protein